MFTYAEFLFASEEVIKLPRKYIFFMFRIRNGTEWLCMTSISGISFMDSDAGKATMRNNRIRKIKAESFAPRISIMANCD